MRANTTNGNEQDNAGKLKLFSALLVATFSTITSNNMKWKREIRGEEKEGENKGRQ